MELLLRILSLVVGIILLWLIIKISSRILKLIFGIIVLAIAISLFVYVIEAALPALTGANLFNVRL